MQNISAVSFTIMSTIKYKWEYCAYVYHCVKICLCRCLNLNVDNIFFPFYIHYISILLSHRKYSKIITHFCCNMQEAAKKHTTLCNLYVRPLIGSWNIAWLSDIPKIHLLKSKPSLWIFRSYLYKQSLDNTKV